MNQAEVKQLSQVFLEHVYAIPQGEKIRGCLQCGTCSASCPTSYAMEYGPREIIALLRAGMLDRALRSNTVWFCTSCYSCTVRCPAGIPFTDVMYELKRLGVEHGLYPKDDTTAKMARAFVASVNRSGRNHEMEIILRYYWPTSMLKMLAQLPLALRLLIRGRLGLWPHKVKDLESIRKMMAVIEPPAAAADRPPSPPPPEAATRGLAGED